MLIEIPYRPSDSVRLRIWPVLVIGFSTLVILIAFSGFSALRRATGTYAETSTLHSDELHTEQALARLRSEVLLSAIAVRDLLALPPGALQAKREELGRLQSSTEQALNELRSLIRPEDAPKLGSMRRHVDEYWRSLAPLLHPANDLRSAAAAQAFLKDEVLPRREAVLQLAEEVEELTRNSFQKGRAEIDRRQGDLWVYVSEIVGATILVGLLVAVVSVVRIAELEKTATRQHRAGLLAEGELRRLSQQLVNTQEDERRSLSRDLHDQIGQVLTAVRIGIGNLEEALGPGADHVRPQLDQAKRLSEQALRSVRDLAMGLRPAMLDDLGLGAALEWQARQHSRLCGVPVSVSLQGEVDHLPDAQRTFVYRAVQEALTNAAKHSRASAIEVSVSGRETGLSIEVRDNGEGFDMESRRKSGLGLIGIKERVRQLGGEMSVESKPGQGTAVSAWIPLGPDEREAA